MALTASQHAFIRDNPFVGILTTLRPDGSPHATVVWVDADENGLSVNTARGRAKPRHIEADGRVGLTVVDPANSFRWISLSGTATLSDDGADEQIDRLARKYTEHDHYPWRQEGERRVAIRITPEIVDGMGIE